MSIYFIHAEAILRNGCVAEKVGKVVIATNAVDALAEFWSEGSVIYDECSVYDYGEVANNICHLCGCVAGIQQ